ncbi:MULTISPECIES: DUF7266 family protein [Halomicrobium]|uniref:Flagellin n=2 Tax=Halomicrobium mukohataei TaxID=57705 RepID=C7NWP6_HALMD|nr:MULTISPECIES: hypothetical protein [Halomicrobium]ACV48256.1 conserved hypothetical protein [Halomicrobium mukohataei DSM 12286]QCD66676.1 hypothetical protein E5139_13860 [Halomicrobium mukohataei]QFR21482.1 hypothetical protein GBQ70_13875 [Halomicrobium sp. ZPS1]
MDNRAVTPAVTHALTIGISAIMITGLLVGAGGLLDDQRSYVVENGLENVGSAVTSELVSMDQFNTTGVDADLSYTTTHPARVGGRTYDVVLEPDSPKSTLVLEATGESQRTVVYRFENESSVCASAVDGGKINVVFDVSEPCLELRDP